MKPRHSFVITAALFFPVKASLRRTVANDRNRYRNPNESAYTKQCKALVSEIEEGPEKEGSVSWNQELNCETSGGEIFTIEDTPLEWIQSNLASNTLISGDSDLILPIGATVNHDIGKIKPNGPTEFRNRPVKGKRRKLAVVQGVRTVLVVRVRASGGETTQSMAALADSVFGAASGLANANDPVNLRSQVLECSYNKLEFVPLTDRTRVTQNFGGSDIVNGAVTVDVNTAVSEGHTVMRNAITSQLKIMFDVSHPRQLADHIMYCLPPGTMGGIAYAFINGWMSVYNDSWCTFPSVQMHEMGHNLNLAHSNEARAYNDQSGVMGYSYRQDDGPQMCFNAAKSWQLGWYEGTNQLITISTGGVRSYVGQLSGIVNYDHVNNPNRNSNPILIKLNQNQKTNPDDYYITFNSKRSFNSETVEGGNQVTIVRASGEGMHYAESDLISKLSAHRSYTITNFDGTTDSATITVNEISVSHSFAEVSICIGDCDPAPTQSPTLAPSQSPTLAPSQTLTLAPSQSPIAAPTLVPSQLPSIAHTPAPSSIDSCSTLNRRECKESNDCIWYPTQWQCALSSGPEPPYLPCSAIIWPRVCNFRKGCTWQQRECTDE
mmetsp:Transcript_69179/g.102873  ORF Transcript_69179/g.102873 Transcript_69179/m.102873 type:complete len:606 (+) Transcript_69179:219-2036(+)